MKQEVPSRAHATYLCSHTGLLLLFFILFCFILANDVLNSGGHKLKKKYLKPPPHCSRHNDGTKQANCNNYTDNIRLHLTKFSETSVQRLPTLNFLMNARGPTWFLQIIFLHIMLIIVTWLTAGSWCISWRKKVKAMAKTLIALLLYRGFKVYQNTALNKSLCAW